MNERIAPYRDLIRTLVPLQNLSSARQDEVMEVAEVLEVPSGTYVFRQGDSDPFTFYLLDGELELSTRDQLVSRVTAGSDGARYALAQLQPRQLSARARSAAILMRLQRAVLERLLAAEAERGADTLEVCEVEAEDSGDWMTRLLASELFARIPAANIQRMFAQLEPLEVKAGDAIVAQGEPGDYYYIIQTGRSAVSRRTSTGAEVRLAELADGDSFGEEALVAGAHRNASVRMLSDGSLLRLTKEDFVELIRKPILRGIGRAEAEAQLRQGACWLDVRSAERFKQGAMPGALNLPAEMVRSQSGRLASGRRYIVYCDDGNASAVAAFLLAQRGFDAAYLLGGLAGAEQTPSGASLTDGVEAEVRASALKAELDQASLQLEQALRHKAQAEASLNAETQALESRLMAQREELARQYQGDAERLKAEARKAREGVEAEFQRRLEAEREKLAEESRQANLALHEARRLKLELQAAKRAADDEVARVRAEQESRLQRLRAEAESRLKEEQKKLEEAYAWKADELARLKQLKEEAEAQLALERQRLREESAEARQRLEEARRVQREAEEARLAATREAEEKLARQQAIERQLQESVEERVREERRKLEDEYRRNAEELEQARAVASREAAAREEAERKLAQQQVTEQQLHETVEGRVQEERRRLEEEYRRTSEELEQARLTATREAEEKLARQQEIEQRLRESVQAKIQEERRKLEAEFRRNSEELEQARREREAAEAARRAAEEEAERIIAENRAAHERLRAEEEARLAEERQRLEQEAQRLQGLLAEARRSKQEAAEERRRAQAQLQELQAAQRAAAGRSAEEAAELGARLKAAEAAMEAANRHAQEASESEAQAQAASRATAVEMERQDEAAESLRAQLAAELEEWTAEVEAEENAPERQAFQQEREMLMQRIRERAQAARREAEARTETLFADIAAQFDNPD